MLLRDLGVFTNAPARCSASTVSAFIFQAAYRLRCEERSTLRFSTRKVCTFSTSALIFSPVEPRVRKTCSVYEVQNT